jgi:hypothetical protein
LALTTASDDGPPVYPSGSAARLWIALTLATGIVSLLIGLLVALL